MAFKRQEGFRFAFGEPLEAQFVVLLDGNAGTLERERNACKVLDISPRGMKILTDVNLKNFFAKSIQLEMYFSLDLLEIKAIADIVWSKPYGSNFQYGLTFTRQIDVEELIIEELKTRRRKEIKQAKLKSSGL